MRLAFIALAGALALAACGPSTPDPESVTLPSPAAVPETTQNAQGTTVPCVNGGDINISSQIELKSPYREKMLTPGAQAQGIKVFTGYWSDNQYGSIVLTYWDNTGRCFLWAETLTLQEYSVRLGMSPVGISPHYEAAPAAPEGGTN